MFRRNISAHSPFIHRGGAMRYELDDIRVATPCDARWEEMAGDDRVRHCGQCNKAVYNLSSMPRHEAQALVFGHEERLCVRFYRRTDGTLLTQDCPVGVAERA